MGGGRGTVTGAPGRTGLLLCADMRTEQGASTVRRPRPRKVITDDVRDTVIRVRAEH
jgi:hypothetical protein